MTCAGTCLPALSFGDLEQLWINAGGPTAVAPIAAAIAAAESYGGVPNAVNPIDNGGTQTSWGLWQVSDGTHNSYVANWQDPASNAAAAVAKYKGAGGFSPWGTFTSGAYLSHLQDANANGTSGTGTSSSSSSSSTSTGSGFAPVALSSQTTALIITFVVLLIGIGLFAMSRPKTAAA